MCDSRLIPVCDSFPALFLRLCSNAFPICSHCFLVSRLTFGFPAVVALSLDRQAYAVMRGSFSEKNAEKFLHGVTNGRQATIKLSRPINDLIVETEPWDGLDGKPIEEELSLADIMGWDDDEGGDDSKKGEEL